MNIQKRTLVLGSLTACFLAAYMMARYYSPVLVAHVVEETLVQKVPEGTNATLVRERFRRLIDPIAHREDRLKKLISVSAYLEKVQRLTPDELENLLCNTRELTGLESH